ncbi:Hed1p LALA0_S02e09318g [Lachancea lanzarotensis]|uniref:LALA0S02e09318g1_1 n=1 Tax=Lachancea lanzarotensis TaxID=1245769 RepID=A0A0C7N3L9_9SACH|nr:uncharacterized protein LALA0_S02e09318g [Lachancea lanzarotensis]CEP61214.1 LALA0S02e09318g1_1 [Lachancea lanzarotensis]
MVLKRSSTLDIVYPKSKRLEERSQTVGFEGYQSTNLVLGWFDERRVDESGPDSQISPVPRYRNNQRRRTDIEYPKHTHQKRKRFQTISFPPSLLENVVQAVFGVECMDEVTVEQNHPKEETLVLHKEPIVVIESSQESSETSEAENSLDAETTKVWKDFSEGSVRQMSINLKYCDETDPEHSKYQPVHQGPAEDQDSDRTLECDQTLIPNAEGAQSILEIDTSIKDSTIDCSFLKSETEISYNASIVSPDLTLEFPSFNSASRGQTEDLVAETICDGSVARNGTDKAVSITVPEPDTFNESTGEIESGTDAVSPKRPYSHSSHPSGTHLRNRATAVHKSLKHLIFKANQECFQVDSQIVRYRTGLSKTSAGLPHLHECFNGRKI